MTFAAALIYGIGLGLSSGISPGPLTTLVISETLRHDLKAGIKVSVAPLITDLPIILLSVLVISQFALSRNIFGIICAAGSLFLAYLAYESFFAKVEASDFQGVKPQSLKKGIITNFLNPNPYLFWMTIGGPIIVGSAKQNIFSAAIFLAAFYFLLVGTKIVLTLITVKFRKFLTSRYYIFTLRILSAVLLFYAISFLIDAIKYFKPM